MRKTLAIHSVALKNESSIERQILDYLQENPAARDTLRGILEWWLLKQRIKESTSDVQTALANLVAKEKLSAQTGLDGQVHYSLPRKTRR